MFYDTNELIYMSHFKDETVERALFEHFEGFIVYLVLSVIDTWYQRLETYRDDFIQEAWIALFQALETYREDKNTSFLTYLSVVVKRKIMNVAKKYHIREPMSYGAVYELDYFINEMPGAYDKDYNNQMFNPEYFLRFNEAKQSFDNLYKNMNQKEKDLLKLWLSGKSYEECANELSIPTKTYDGRKQALKKKIKRELAME